MHGISWHSRQRHNLHCHNRKQIHAHVSQLLSAESSRVGLVHFVFGFPGLQDYPLQLERQLQTKVRFQPNQRFLILINFKMPQGLIIQDLDQCRGSDYSGPKR